MGRVLDKIGMFFLFASVRALGSALDQSQGEDSNLETVISVQVKRSPLSMAFSDKPVSSTLITQVLEFC